EVDLEGFRVEADDLARCLLLDDLPDRPQAQAHLVPDQERLGCGQARVDEQPEAAQARLALYATDDVVGEGHPLEGGPEDELTGVEDEGAVVVDLDEAGELLEVLLHVYD